MATVYVNRNSEAFSINVKIYIDSNPNAKNEMLCEIKRNTILFFVEHFQLLCSV